MSSASYQFGEALRVLPVRTGRPLPIVVDSPHSWRDWPAMVRTVASTAALGSAWDAYVDELWAYALDHRAPLLCAGFHRALVDANRARDDIDPLLLAGVWPTPLHPSEKSRRGFGLIRRLALPDVPMYDGRLSVAEVEARIRDLYDPYHQKLTTLIDDCEARFGYCLHLDCHSMKSVGNAMNDDEGTKRPDIVVSDLDGLTAPPLLTAAIADRLAALGYRVQVNDPYKGAELIRRHSDVASRRFSVQIEINRALYMNEADLSRNASFQRLAADLRVFVSSLPDVLSPYIDDRADPKNLFATGTSCNPTRSF